MAPEQLAGERTDARSDQFSFCVALFEGLHGVRPFTGSTLEELKERITNGKLERARRPVPSWLGAAIQRGLAADPAARFPDMDALLAALQNDDAKRARLRVVALGAVLACAAALALVPVLTRDAQSDLCTGGREEAARVWNGGARSRLLYGADGPVSPSSLWGLFGRLDRFTSEWARAYRSTCRATRVAGTQSEHLLDARMACLRRQLRDVDALLGEASGDRARTLAATEAALPSPIECTSIENERVPPPRAARAVERVARTLSRVRAQVATAQAESALALSERAMREADATRFTSIRAEARLARAHALRARVDLPAAEEQALSALLLFEEAHDDDGAARAWLALTAIAGESGRPDRAALHARHARAAVVRAGAPPLLDASLCATNGIVLTELGRHDEARRELERALVLRRRALGDSHPEVARIHTSLGNLARVRGDLAGALRHHRRALAIDRETLGPRHPAVGRDLHNVAGVLRLRGDLSAAMEHYQNALEVKRESLGDAHLDVALTHNSLGLLLSQLGREDRAREHYERALSIFRERSHPDEAIVQLNLGLLDKEDRDYAGALARFERALALDTPVHGASARVLRALLAAADAERSLGRRQAARTRYERAQTMARAIGDSALERRAADALSSLATRPSAPPAPIPARSQMTYLPGEAWDGP